MHVPILWPKGTFTSSKEVGAVVKRIVSERTRAVERIYVIALMQSKGRGLLRTSGCGGAHLVVANLIAEVVALTSGLEEANSRR